MKKLTIEQMQFIRTEHKKVTIADMSEILNLSYTTIRGFCDRYCLKPITEYERKKRRSDEPYSFKIKQIVRLKDDPSSKPFERPKTEYTNSPSPYGIADELFNRKLTKQCKY